MDDRSRHVAFLLSLVLIAVACVPTPAGRRPPDAGDSPSSTTAAPITEPPAPNPTGATPRPSFVRPTPTPLPTFFVHLVRAGDTLSSIARTYATTRLSIAFWNRAAYPSLDPESADYAPNRIVIGWMLRLIPNVEIDEEELLGPPPSPSDGGAPAAPSPETAGPTGADIPGPSIGGASLVVRHGDRSVPTIALTAGYGYPGIVGGLRARGLTPVTLDTMFGA